ncbi:hypothetical protein FRB97_007036, partial [Tulasnella sp. 331]
IATGPVCEKMEGKDEENRAIDEGTEPMLETNPLHSMLPSHSTEKREVRYLQSEATWIYRLPFELLHKIFRICCGVEESEYLQQHPWPMYTSPCTLAHVCRVWYDVSKGSPDLWSILRSNQPRSLSGWWLELSRDSPLSIDISNFTGRKMRWRWPSVTQAIHRWWWVRLHLAVEVLPPALETTSAPRLEHLELVVAHGPTMILDLFNDHAPNLRHVSLTNLALRDWGSPVLRDLRTLELLDVPSHEPSLPHLIGILIGCPDLEKLVLKVSRVDHENEEPQGVGGLVSAIQLPCLKILHLNNVGWKTIRALLAMIRTPCCSDYHFSSFERTENDPHAIIPQDILFQFRERLASGDTLKLTYGYEGISFDVDSHDPNSSTFRIKILDLATHHAIIHWAFHLVDVNREARGPIQASVVSTQNGLDEASVRLLRRYVPGVTLVKFYYCGEMGDVVTALAAPETELDGRRSWMWPGLSEIYIDNSPCDGAPLVEMIERRHIAATAHTGAEPAPWELEPLKKFMMEIWAPERDTTDRGTIQNILGDVAMFRGNGWERDE